MDLGSSSAFKKRKDANQNGQTTNVKIKAEGENDSQSKYAGAVGDTTTTTTTIATEDDPSKVIIAPKPLNEEDESAAFSQIFSSGDEWPFEGVCEQLFLDLFDQAWEIRHGASMGLRDIIKVSGSGAGMIIGVDKDTNRQRHERWLEDASVRLLCVLALDRFADFVGDLVVLPIVETASQTLGATVQLCSTDLALKVVNKGLIILADSSETMPSGSAITESELRKWQVRHAGLIGLKYLMAVRQDLVRDFVIDNASPSQSRVFRSILRG